MESAVTTRLVTAETLTVSSSSTAARMADNTQHGCGLRWSEQPGRGLCQQSETAFKDQLSQYGIDDLDADVQPYIVFGNANADPQQYGHACGLQQPGGKLAC